MPKHYSIEMTTKFSNQLNVQLSVLTWAFISGIAALHAKSVDSYFLVHHAIGISLHNLVLTSVVKLLVF